jgi:hypothetical protein
VRRVVPLIKKPDALNVVVYKDTIADYLDGAKSVFV